MHLPLCRKVNTPLPTRATHFWSKSNLALVSEVFRLHHLTNELEGAPPLVCKGGLLPPNVTTFRFTSSKIKITTIGSHTPFPTCEKIKIFHSGTLGISTIPAPTRIKIVYSQ